MLNTIVEKKLLRATAIIAFWPAAAVGEDVQIYKDAESALAPDSTPLATFFGLRQQAEKDSEDSEPYYSLTDFIAPKETGLLDHIGAFAVSCGFGVDEQCVEFEKSHDDYSIIMIKALADRLTEALAERVHADVRKTYWGYSPDEDLEPEEMLQVKYQGIRPAPGYPSQPEHTEKDMMWKVMDVEKETGITLTESMAMTPAAAVSGVFFGHKEAKYFAVGKIEKDQVVDYAARKGMEVSEVERWLSSSLCYDADD
ncbi:hypothetical protein HKX48_003034 [Thoreauomyces humboldtii]|nr:hypothetical protein HKX48_003034 [Thoreauomyces humboldtii]